MARELGEIVILEDPRPEKGGDGRPVGGPIDLRRIGARPGERQAPLVGFAARMRLGDAAIFVAHRFQIGRFGVARQQRADDADGAAGVVDMDRLAAPVARADLHRRMDAAGGGAADQQRDVEALALHLRRDMRHFVERGRDQAGKADDVDLLLARHRKDLFGGRHHAEVDDLVIVAGEHDADDVLADVVHVALDGGHQDLAGAVAALAAARRLFGLHVGQQPRHRLLHHPGGFDDLRQEHLSRAEQVADDVHAGHQRAFDDMQRALGGRAAPPRCRRRYSRSGR